MQASTEIACSADQVWAVVGNFEDLSWLTTVDAYEVQEDGVRVLEIGGVCSTEKLQDRDDATRTLTYVILSRGHAHEASVTVRSLPSGSTVVWRVARAADNAEMLSEQFQLGLDRLKATLEEAGTP